MDRFCYFQLFAVTFLLKIFVDKIFMFLIQKNHVPDNSEILNNYKGNNKGVVHEK
jgi:hypothetical protein